jgi:hypothetical protein
MAVLPPDLPPKAVVIAALEDKDKSVRASALGLLQVWTRGTSVPDAAAPVIGRLLDEDTHVRLLAMSVLQNMGPDAKAATAKLKSALGDDDGKISLAAAGALVHIDPAIGIPAAIKALGDKDPQVRESFAGTLADLPRTHKDWGPLLKRQALFALAIALQVDTNNAAKEMISLAIQRIRDADEAPGKPTPASPATQAEEALLRIDVVAHPDQGGLRLSIGLVNTSDEPVTAWSHVSNPWRASKWFGIKLDDNEWKPPAEHVAFFPRGHSKTIKPKKRAEISMFFIISTQDDRAKYASFGDCVAAPPGDHKLLISYRPSRDSQILRKQKPGLEPLLWGEPFELPVTSVKPASIRFTVAGKLATTRPEAPPDP